MSMELQDKRMCKAEFGFSGVTVDYNNNNNNNDNINDNSNRSACDEDWDILNMLDLPMEGLEGDGFAEDWAQLGPIPTEVLTELEYPMLSNKTQSFQAPSPNSVLESRSTSSNNNGVSFGVELSIPVRTRTKRLRPTFNSWLMSGFIVLLKNDKKRKKLYPNVENENVVGSKKCAHCGVTKTPQWRGGPMGPKTLCNACGVRYRSGRLFPEYRPAASPTFVPALHSNSHRKVIEMRQKTVM
ncbi:GATA transcription factor 11-like [Bidens hawaiensis]|uniref:GATA transcription factor 11-like n=1 Tax=Bidens hawaiensis TaxID=980011 RepID=UPI004049CD4F